MIHRSVIQSEIDEQEKEDEVDGKWKHCEFDMIKLHQLDSDMHMDDYEE